MSVSHKVAVRIRVASSTNKVATKHLLKDAMNATNELKEIYSLEDFKEIANHGCESGVCRQHIYYGDTIKYYDKYENEIMDELVLNYGTEFLVELFKDADACLDIYKNKVTWAFIELTAIDAVDDARYEYAMTV